MTAAPTHKPRVFIAMHYLEIGGAETGLTGLLSALRPERVEVDLFVYAHRGPLMKYIPSWVNLLPENSAYRLTEAPIKEVLRRGRLDIAAARLAAKLDYRRFMRKASGKFGHSIFSFTARRLDRVLPAMSSKEYDLAISFIHPHHYVLHHVKARRKMAWIHTDYSTIGLHWPTEAPVWSAYDYIAALSAENAAALTANIPEAAGKIRLIDNALPAEMMRRRALEGEAPELTADHFNILSVGRLSDAKNYVKVPAMMKRIVELTGRSDLRWYIIGGGNAAYEAAIRQAIAETGMEKHVVLLGERANPYPYIRACSLYAQPSLYEGRSVAVREAQILGRPVAITAYPSARAQIVDGEEGVIVPLDTEGAAQEMARLIADPGRLEKMAETNAGRDFSAAAETAEKIYAIVNSITTTDDNHER